MKNNKKTYNEKGKVENKNKKMEMLGEYTEV